MDHREIHYRSEAADVASLQLKLGPPPHCKNRGAFDVPMFPKSNTTRMQRTLSVESFRFQEEDRGMDEGEILQEFTKPDPGVHVCNRKSE